jgi:hypothetical protein
MIKERNRKRHDPFAEEDNLDLKRQKFIFLWTMMLMVILLIALYLQMDMILITGITTILILSTIGLYIKFRNFYSMRDRGQRTACITISMYASLILTLICAYYYVQDEPLTQEYALVFLFGFFFFTYMVYKSASRYMVVGNKRQRFR